MKNPQRTTSSVTWTQARETSRPRRSPATCCPFDGLRSRRIISVRTYETAAPTRTWSSEALSLALASRTTLSVGVRRVCERVVGGHRVAKREPMRGEHKLFQVEGRGVAMHADVRDPADAHRFDLDAGPQAIGSAHAPRDGAPAAAVDCR